MAKSMDWLAYGLGGECGSYSAAPGGTLLREVSHRSPPGTPMAERVVLVRPHALSYGQTMSEPWGPLPFPPQN